MTHSILNTTKELLMVPIEEVAFDPTLIVHINSVFMILQQMGVGPDTVFSISSKDQTWDEFLPDDLEKLNAVKTYMYMKVRMMFDPPTLSFLLTSYEHQIAELEHRLILQASPPLPPTPPVEEV